MPRLHNTLTGAVMSVPEAVAERLGGEWVPADTQASESKETPKRGRTRKPDTSE